MYHTNLIDNMDVWKSYINVKIFVLTMLEAMRLKKIINLKNSFVLFEEITVSLYVIW